MNPLNPEAIGKSLESNIFGSELIILPRIDSTNDYAKRNGLSHGTVVLAEEQTAGKGRMGRTWSAPAGKNILMSVSLLPERPLHSIQIITLGAAVSVSDTIEKFCNLPVQVKWPNDVFINGKKVCGILTEGQIRGSQFLRLVVGIGCNVNQEMDEFPEELLYPSTSLREELGKTLDRNILAAGIIDAMEKWYDQIISGEINEMIAKWKNRCSHMNKPVSITRDDAIIRGIFKDITQDGSALVFSKSGEQIKVTSGDLRQEKNDSSL